MICLWEKLKNTNKPILIYGMGNGADKIIQRLSALNIAVSGVFASDGFVRGQSFHGFRVISYSDAVSEFGDFIVLVSFGTSRPDVLANIRRIAAERELYIPDVPVYGSGTFDLDYVLLHKKELSHVYSLLHDDKSKKVFENTVMYKLTGQPEYLYNCESAPSETYSSILRLNDRETYVDLGAYNGDTVKEFLQYTNGRYEHIYAVEPDIKTFKKLKASIGDLERIELFNICISDKACHVPFKMNGGRNSSVGTSGQLFKADCVDNLLGGKAATFIKMDVEGEESAAIAGAQKTISASKPKMLISCYHRNEDIFSIPMQIQGIRNDYKIYMRHYPCVPAWDTVYLFV